MTPEEKESYLALMDAKYRAMDALRAEALASEANQTRPDELVPEPPEPYPKGKSSYMSDTPGNVQPADIATLSLLNRPYGAGYGFGGGYGGSGLHFGNSNLAAEAHANGTAVAAKIEGNAEKIDAQSAMFDSAERSRQFKDLSDQMTAAEKNLSDQHTATTQALNGHSLETLKAINEAAKEAAKCCCDAQLEAQKNTADLKAEILAVETRTVTRELDRAERTLQASDGTAAIVAAMKEQTSLLVASLARPHHP